MSRIKVLAVVAVVTVLIGLGWFLSTTSVASKQRSSLTAVGIPEYQIAVVTPGDSSYQSLMSNSRLPKGDTNVERFSVFVVNQRDQPIAALALRWDLLLSDGRTISNWQSDCAGLNIETVQGNPPRFKALIAPNANRRFTLLNSSSGSPGGFRTTGTDRSALQLSQSKAIQVSVDGVLFSDGTFVGPNTKHYFERVQTELRARRDLLEEAATASKRESINPLTAIERWTKRRASSSVEGDDAEKQLQMDSEQLNLYLQKKHTYAQQILDKRRFKGDDVTLDFINGELRIPAIEIRKF